MDVIFTRLENIWAGFLRLTPNFLAAIAILVVTWLAAGRLATLILRVVSTTRLRRSLRDLLSKVIAAALWVAGLLTATIIVFPTVQFDEVLTVLGVGSLALGFAFKDVFENFIAGLVLLARNVIEIGDVVECEGETGVVDRITVRDTHLMTLDGKRVILPNATLFKNKVEVLTHGDSRRITIICGVAYSENVDRAREVIQDAVEECSTVRSEKPVEIFAKAFASSSIDFEVTWWSGSKPLEVRQSTDEVVAAVKRALDDTGIEIPFPYRTLTFKKPIPLAQNEVGT